MQVALKPLAVTAVRVFKYSQFTFAIAPNDCKGVLEWQVFELYAGQFGDALFGQVALGAHIDDVALNQVVGLGIGVENFAAIDAQLVHAGNGCFGDFVDDFDLGQALCNVLANLRLLRQYMGTEQDDGGSQQGF